MRWNIGRIPLGRSCVASDAAIPSVKLDRSDLSSDPSSFRSERHAIETRAERETLIEQCKRRVLQICLDKKQNILIYLLKFHCKYLVTPSELLSEPCGGPRNNAPLVSSPPSAQHRRFLSSFLNPSVPSYSLYPYVQDLQCGSSSSSALHGRGFN